MVMAAQHGLQATLLRWRSATRLKPTVSPLLNFG